MIVIDAVAACAIKRGQFCVIATGNRYRPDPTMTGLGGIARRTYGGEWPPVDIAEGELFELMVDGGAIGLIGSRQLWVEIRDGRFRMDLSSFTDQGELRAALKAIEPVKL